MKLNDAEDDFDNENQDPDIIESSEETSPKALNKLNIIISAIESWEESSKKPFAPPPHKETSTQNSGIKKAQEIAPSHEEAIQSINDNHFHLFRELIEEDLADETECLPKTHSRCVNEILYEMHWADKRSSQFSEELRILEGQRPRNNQRLLQIYEELLLLGKLLKSKEQLFLKEVPYALKKLEFKIHRTLQNIEGLFNE